MKYLLDTVVWVWSLYDVDRLNARALEVLGNGREEIYLSAASAWELSIKMRLQKMQFPEPPTVTIPRFMARQGLRPLAISQAHATKTYELPLRHSDPFDRLLIAQALLEEMTILTADRRFGKYEVDVVWCGL